MVRGTRRAPRGPMPTNVEEDRECSNRSVRGPLLQPPSTWPSCHAGDNPSSNHDISTGNPSLSHSIGSEN